MALEGNTGDQESQWDPSFAHSDNHDNSSHRCGSLDQSGGPTIWHCHP